MTNVMMLIVPVNLINCGDIHWSSSNLSCMLLRTKLRTIFKKVNIILITLYFIGLNGVNLMLWRQWLARSFSNLWSLLIMGKKNSIPSFIYIHVYVMRKCCHRDVTASAICIAFISILFIDIINVSVQFENGWPWNISQDHKRWQR